MSLRINSLGQRALELDVHGALTADDYKRFTPMAEERIREHGNVNLLVRASDFRGVTPPALWQDLKFDVAHYNDVSRLALVAKKDSRDWMVKLAEPFTGAVVKYFPEGEIDAARQWVEGASAA